MWLRNGGKIVKTGNNWLEANHLYEPFSTLLVRRCCVDAPTFPVPRRVQAPPAKNFIRYQAVPSGTSRYDAVRPGNQIMTGAETRPRFRDCARCGSRRLPLRGERAGARPEGMRASVILALNHPLSTLNFLPGPTTRQYPAIPGNTRTMAHFLAAYCRVTDFLAA